MHCDLLHITITKLIHFNYCLQIALEKSKANRERLQNIQNERVKLNAIMEQQLAEFKEIKPQILDMQKSLIDSISRPDC